VGILKSISRQKTACGHLVEQRCLRLSLLCTKRCCTILIQFFLSWRLRFGDVDLSSSADDEDDFVQEVRITKITKHQKYVEGVAYFDIAVLIIEPIEYTGFVRPVCLPSSKDFMVDKYDGVSKVNK
jgi:hypothetical protein